MRPAYQIVMEALEIGIEVKMGRYTWVICNGTDAAGNTGKMLCVKMWNETKQEPHYVNPDVSFNEFLRMCDKLSEKDLLSIGGSIVMNRKYFRRTPT